MVILWRGVKAWVDIVVKKDGVYICHFCHDVIGFIMRMEVVLTIRISNV